MRCPLQRQVSKSSSFARRDPARTIVQSHRPPGARAREPVAHDREPERRAALVQFLLVDRGRQHRRLEVHRPLLDRRRERAEVVQAERGRHAGGESAAGERRRISGWSEDGEGGCENSSPGEPHHDEAAVRVGVETKEDDGLANLEEALAPRNRLVNRCLHSSSVFRKGTMMGERDAPALCSHDNPRPSPSDPSCPSTSPPGQRSPR